MDDVVQALMMAFAVLVFVIALSISMMLIREAQATAEVLVQYSDLTAFYDNIELHSDDPTVKKVITERIVGLDTVVPTLYRYYKENFCVKIYDGRTSEDNPELLQIFDVNIETNLRRAIINTNASQSASEKELIRDEALQKVYNDRATKYCLFGAPWLGSTETIKQRIDFFINGDAGYINNTFVNYKGTESFSAIVNGDTKFKERFISYSYSGDTEMTDEGEIMIDSAQNKDKIVINYIILSDTTVVPTTP